MKAMFVRDVRKFNYSPEEFSLEMGITLEQAKKSLEFAMNSKTPSDSIVILDRAVFPDGTVLGAGNVEKN